MFKVINRNTRTNETFYVFTPFSSVSIVDFEQGSVSWEITLIRKERYEQEKQYQREEASLKRQVFCKIA